jgi:hypothetical protein
METFSFPPVPVVIRVDGQPVDVTADHDAGFLLALLGAVVAELAEALQVGRIEEESHVASMGLNVVSNAGGNCSALRRTATAQRLILKLLPP